MKNKKESRRSFLKKAGPAAIAAPLSPMLLSGAAVRAGGSVAPGFPMIQSGAGRKRNVLFIGTDDCCTRLGVYGGPIKTPHLERFAKSAVLFNRAYCQYPLCSPSRSSLMTGRAPDTTKVYDNSVHFREVLPDVVTLPQTFLKNGYFTARAGKIYHFGNPGQIGTSGLDDPPSWNETANPAGVDHVKEQALLKNLAPGLRTDFSRNMGSGGFRGRGPGRGTGAANRGPGRWLGEGDPRGAEVPGGNTWGITPGFYDSQSKAELHTDYLVADAVIAMLEKRRQQPNDPWFIGAGFYKPHVPWIVPSEYFDMYPLDETQATASNESEMHIAPEWAYWTRPSNWGMTGLQRREATRAYYAAASFLDANIGRILNALDRLGFSENTTIVFWADHGWQLGEHGQWEKRNLFEPSARVPLMIGGAGVAGAGHGCPRTVENLDVYPTLVELCGLQLAPDNLHGKSLAPLLSNPSGAWSRPAISQAYRSRHQIMPFPDAPPGGVMGYSIRTERYRYTFWKEGSEGEELYDYQVDPREMRNLAKDSRVASLKATLRASLEKICRERGMANAPGALA